MIFQTEAPTRRNIDTSGETKELDDGNRIDGEADLESRAENHVDVSISEELKDIVEPPAMRARGHKNTLRSSILRTECINENKKETEKCSKACHKAHSDVCDRRSCSLRAKRTLRTECGFNCKKVFAAICNY